MSRSSQELAAKNRATIVAGASRLFRRKGVDGVGVRELMASAGLTQGGFVGLFGSKDILAAEACTAAFDSTETELLLAFEGNPEGRAQRFVEFYFAPRPPEEDCPMVTLSADSTRSQAGGPMRRAFTEGLRRLASVIGGTPATPDRLTLLAAMVGAAVLKRASEDAGLAAEIEDAVLQYSKTVA